MPLERAKDSYQSLVRLSAYAEHRDLNTFASTADLGDTAAAEDHCYEYNEEGYLQRTNGSAVDGLEYEGEGASLADTEPTYWKYGADTGDWKDYETTEPLMPMRLMESGLDVYGYGTVRADSERDNGICFTLFPFYGPQKSENGDEGGNAGEDAKQSIMLYPPPKAADPTSTTDKPVRGIIRKASNYPQVAPGLNAKQRKSFRPQMYRPLSNKTHPSGTKQAKPKHVQFARTKREVRICPLHKMTPEERAQTWWSSEEFDLIKKSMLVLIQPSEIDYLCKTWLAADTEQKMHKKGNGGDGVGSSGSDTGDKHSKRETNSKSWWHKYGDSRRGLERYASPEEAPQILDSYQEAVYQVLLEQERQRRKCECWWPFDSTSLEEKRRESAEKIARVYKEYTAWSRDLALASGASDADAVRCDFDDAKRKSREYFLLRQIYQNEGRIHAHMPDFMAPRGFQPTGFLRYSNVPSPVTVPSGDEYE